MLCARCWGYRGDKKGRILGLRKPMHLSLKYYYCGALCIVIVSENKAPEVWFTSFLPVRMTVGDLNQRLKYVRRMIEVSLRLSTEYWRVQIMAILQG